MEALNLFEKNGITRLKKRWWVRWKTRLKSYSENFVSFASFCEIWKAVASDRTPYAGAKLKRAGDSTP